MNYRRYRREDFAALYAIEEACFASPERFGRRHMRWLVESRRAATWIVEEGGRMAGFAIADWMRGADGTEAYIQTIEVLPEARGRGAGRELLRRIEGSARAAGAERIGLHV